MRASDTEFPRMDICWSRTGSGQKHHPLFVGYRGETGIGRRTDQRPGRFPLPGSSSKKYSRIQVQAARRVGSGLQVACARACRGARMARSKSRELGTSTLMVTAAGAANERDDG
jgi:hypothetical protein